MDINGGNSNPLLPQDLTTAILLRLPVTSLLRFQCVCKKWRNLFKTQFFISQHLHHSSHQNPFLILETGVCSRPYCTYLINSEMEIVGCHNHPLIHPNRYVTSKTHHCNGLLCLTISDDTGYVYSSLWNPATREMCIISKDYDLDLGKNIDVGFGFSSIDNDYKVVKIRNSRDRDVETNVEVFSLNVGTWKRVEVGKLDGVGILSHGLAFNGAIFWIGLVLALDEDEQNGGVIVSFDVATEGFTLIPMPPLPSSIIYKSITVYENKLAILYHTLSQESKSSSIHLWVMEEEGASISNKRGCWTKKYTSNPYIGYCLFPLYVWKNEIVCIVRGLPEDEDEADDEGKLVMFNLTTNEFRTSDFPNFFRHYSSFVYAESLVPLGNIHIGHV